MIQSISFYKPHWSLKSSKKYLKDKSIKSIKVGHETDKMIHYRLEDPSKFKSFKSEKYPDDGVLLTIGYPNIVKGGSMNVAELKASELVSKGMMANPLQQVFPLSKQADILDHPVIPMSRRVTIQDVPKFRTDDVISRLLNSGFAPGTMIYEMTKPRSQGGPGFPFATSSSTFTPPEFR